MNNTGISFNEEWIKTITREDFVGYCAMHYPELVKKDVEAYYDRVAPAQKQKNNDTKRNEDAPDGAAK